MTPKVSVVIPVYNGAPWIEDAIASVYAQTVLRTEVIVVNDGSTDASAFILRRLEGEMGPTYQWFTQSNRGDASARNTGVRKATGDLIAFLDQDDVWHPEKLARQLAHLEAEPGLSLSFTAYRHVTDRAPSLHSATRGIPTQTWC